jgi:hypothetical protein
MKSKVVEDADVVTHLLSCDPGAEAGYLTLEAVVTETPVRPRKVKRPDVGIALIDLDHSAS